MTQLLKQLHREAELQRRFMKWNHVDEWIGKLLKAVLAVDDADIAERVRK